LTKLYLDVGAELGESIYLSVEGVHLLIVFRLCVLILALGVLNGFLHCGAIESQLGQFFAQLPDILLYLPHQGVGSHFTPPRLHREAVQRLTELRCVLSGLAQL
jgi:hypothetical protein